MSPLTVSIANTPPNVTLSWVGGEPPFQVERCDALGGPWAEVGMPTMRRTSVQPATGQAGFFRVAALVPMLGVQTLVDGSTRLFWLVPELE